MLVLLFTFVLLVLGVRTRRGTAGLGMAAFVIALAALALVTASRYHHPDPYVASYELLNLQVAASGAVQFQGFVINLDIRFDHFAIAEAGVILMTALFVLAWSRSGARAEAGVPRLHILLVMLVLAGIGVTVTPNLAGLLAYWGLGAAATYLLLSNRWGTPDAEMGRIALALPFAGDMSILAGLGLLYSRYGELDLSRIPGAVHITLGAGQKSLTAACILIVVGAAIRAGAPPLLAWLTGIAEGAPAAVATVQAVWAVLAVGLVFRLLPLIHLAGPQVALAIGVLGALMAVLGPLTALLATGLRRAITATAVGAAGLSFIGLAYGDPARALSGILASAPLRAGMILAAAAIVAAMRTEDMGEMGMALRRMRWSALALLLGALGLSLAFVQAAAVGMRGAPWQVLFVIGLVLIPLSALRAYILVAHGTLERRRAFEPARVRDIASPLRQLSVILTLFGWVFVVLTVVDGWLAFLVPHAPKRPAGVPSLEYAGAAVFGLLLAILTFGRARAFWQRRTLVLGARVGAGLAGVTLAADRLVISPLRRAAVTFDSRLASAETGVLTPLGMAGRLVNRGADAELPLGWVAVAVAVAGGGALLAALLTPGVIR
ncbi:MAG TPA: proton-conducting transporter membrane subunit [Candidatus Dormibacteraeota bacterium]